MHTFQVAQLDIQDVQLVVVFLPSDFDGKTPQEKLDLHAALARCAERDGLPGNVVALWQDASHRTRFIAPPQQHPFFQIMKYEQLVAQVNGELRCEPPVSSPASSPASNPASGS
jgi:hypothetical protein